MTSSYICLMATLYIGAWGGSFVQLVGHLLLVLLWHALVLELSQFFGKLVHSACGKFIQIYTSITDGSWDKLLVMQEKPEYIPVKDLGSFCGVFGKLTHACTTLYHSSTLWFPSLKLVRRSNEPCTSFDWGLQNSSNFPPIVSSVNSSDGKPQDAYWSIPKSPDHAMTFLHCWHSGNAASFHSKIFSHFRCHFRNLW